MVRLFIRTVPPGAVLTTIGGAQFSFGVIYQFCHAMLRTHAEALRPVCIAVRRRDHEAEPGPVYRAGI